MLNTNAKAVIAVTISMNNTPLSPIASSNNAPTGGAKTDTAPSRSCEIPPIRCNCSAGTNNVVAALTDK